MSTAREPWRWAWAAALPIGLAGAAVGLLPWLATGARLPAQALWADQVRPAAMPVAMLPFGFAEVVAIFSLLIVGSATAGIGGRALRVRGWGLVLLVLGVLVVQVCATVQTAAVMRSGLQDRLESDVYVAALVTGTALSILVGLVVTILVASAPRAGALIGLAIGAIGMGAWIGTLLEPARTPQSATGPVPMVAFWVVPALIGLAIAWTGIRSAGRVIAALCALALVWVAPAVVAALSSALSNQVLVRSSSDVIDYAVGVFRTTLLDSQIALPPIIATALVAGAGLGVRALLPRGRRAVPASPAE